MKIYPIGLRPTKTVSRKVAKAQKNAKNRRFGKMVTGLGSTGEVNDG